MEEDRVIIAGQGAACPWSTPRRLRRRLQVWGHPRLYSEFKARSAYQEPVSKKMEAVVIQGRAHEQGFGSSLEKLKRQGITFPLDLLMGHVPVPPALQLHRVRVL